MKISYHQAATEDVIRQFRYYLVTRNVPEVAVRFRDAVRLTVESLCQHPLSGPLCNLRNPQLRDMRSWPVTKFEAIRIYYIFGNDTLRVIRVLHGKRDVRRILEREKPSDDH